ncbi:MAG TPA: c-type cytochrome [Polyangiaceae bacterium]|jgi:cytochrome c oxidase subunit 2
MYELLRRLFFLPRAATELARAIDALHFVVIGTTLLGSLAIAAAAIWLITRYRSDVVRPTPHQSARASREWLLALAVVSAFLAAWVVGYKQFLRFHEPAPNAFTVYVTAKQWMWKFTYPDGRSTTDILTVPEDQPLELVMTSRDVIHSFYLPGFRAKQDVLPGRYVTLSLGAARAGNYRISCAEYCGISHYAMSGELRVLPAREFQAWLEAGSPDQNSSLVELGRTASARHGCFACHTDDGQTHVGPTWSGLFGSEVLLADGTRVLADAAYLTRSMMDPQAEIVAGFQPVMPTYLGSLPQPEAAAIVEYIRSLRRAEREPNPTLPTVQVAPPDAGATRSSAP